MKQPAHIVLATELERKYRREFRLLIKQPLFAVYNREPVTQAREDNYVARSFDGLVQFNRHNQIVRAAIEHFHSTRNQ